MLIGNSQYVVVSVIVKMFCLNNNVKVLNATELYA